MLSKTSLFAFGNLLPILNDGYTDTGYWAVKAIPTEAPAQRDAYWVMSETDTEFSVKDMQLAGDPIVVPRFLMFLVGKSEVNGQGTDGLQILEAKVWWDTDVLGRELAASKERLSRHH